MIMSRLAAVESRKSRVGCPAKKTVPRTAANGQLVRLVQTKPTSFFSHFNLINGHCGRTQRLFEIMEINAANELNAAKTTTEWEDQKKRQERRPRMVRRLDQKNSVIITTKLQTKPGETNNIVWSTPYDKDPLTTMSHRTSHL